MKKITLIMMLFLAANLAFGQLSFGPKIGFNTSKLTTDADKIETDLKNHFNFGVFLRLGKKVYIQPEVNWLTRDGIFTSDDGKGQQDIEIKTVEIPLLLGWRVINLGVGNIRIMAGPSASIVTNSTVDVTNADSFTDPIIEDGDFNDLIWGGNIGAGVDILMFTLDVRYQFGLNNVIKEIEKFDYNSKSNIFAVSLGWKLL